MTEAEQEMLRLAELLVTLGPVEAIRLGERERGFEPIFPGERVWFPAADWSPRDIASVKGHEVRIVAIMARHPGSGAFSRLITNIAKRQLVPIVVEPLFRRMPDILLRWGWKQTIVGDGRARQETWRPTAEWIKQRAG